MEYRDQKLNLDGKIGNRSSILVDNFSTRRSKDHLGGQNESKEGASRMPVLSGGGFWRVKSGKGKYSVDSFLGPSSARRRTCQLKGSLAQTAWAGPSA